LVWDLSFASELFLHTWEIKSLFANMVGYSTLTYQLGVMDDWESSVTLSKISFASNYFYDFGMVGSPVDIVYQTILCGKNYLQNFYRASQS